MSTAWKKELLTACICIFTLGALSLVTIGDYRYLTSKTSKTPDQQHLKTTSSILTPLSNYSNADMLFGQILEKPQQKIPQQLPETRLDLILKGTFTHEDTDKASALIAESTNNTARFFVGDEVPGGAELITVRKGEVILRRNGQDELLKLPYLKSNEKITKKKQRQDFPRYKKNSLDHKPEIKLNQNTSNVNISSSGQKQLKDRLDRLRSNNSNRVFKN